MVWLVGSDGLLGKSVAQCLASSGIQWAGASVDITQSDAVERFIANSGRKIKWIINCGAYTDVDAAETNEEKALAVNAVGCLNLSRSARYNGIKLVHISTNYVFDGNKSSPYNEDDDMHPINAYGRTKAAGEENIAKEMTQFYILRTSCLYGYGGGFVEKMLHRMDNGGDIRVVNDQLMCPTFVGDLAEVVIKLINKADDAKTIFGAERSLRSHVPYGIYHYSSSLAVSVADFVHAILDFGLRYGKTTGQCHIVPCTTAEYAAGMEGKIAPRPLNGALDTAKIAHALKIRVPNWQHSLEAFIKG